MDEEPDPSSPSKANLIATGGALEVTDELIDPYIDLELSNYRTVRLLATGGMGRVYLAAREDGQFERHAAIKILPSGMDESIVRRFEQERSILASLNHAHIAQLHDAGITPDGNLYLVMELVDGQPIDLYCQTNDLDQTKRIELVEQLCSALGFAHQKLVLHRDIKPSNVFVASNGELKLLDFGIAKIVETNEELTQEVAPMTPRYASPEQLQGQTVSVASDIYQTGLLLHSLLTGEQPFSDSSLRDRLNAIEQREEFKFSASAAQQLPKDLRTILQHCLSSDPDARYQSIISLRDDLRRFVEGYPIVVAPPKTHQVIAKWVRRNLLSSAIASAMVLSIVGLTVWYTMSLDASRETAEREARVANQIKNVLIDLLRSGDPDIAQGETPTVLEVVQDGLEKISDATIEDPEARVQVMHTLAEMLANAGASTTAAGVITEAREFAQLNLAPDHKMIWNTTNLAANIHTNLGEYDAASGLFNELLKTIDEPRYAGRPRATAFNGLAVVRWRQGRYAEAIDLSEQAVNHALETLGEENEATLMFQNSLGNHYFSAGQPDKAIELLKTVLPIAIRSLGTTAPTVISMHGNLAGAHYQLLEIEQTLEHLEAARTAIGIVYGPDHPNAIREEVNLGIVYSDAGRFDEGRTLIEGGIRKHAALLGETHPMTVRYRGNLLTALIVNEAYEVAQQECHSLLPVTQDLHGTDHMYTVEVQRDCAVAEFHEGDATAAANDLKQVVEDMRRIAGDDYVFIAELVEYMESLGIN